MPSLIPKSSLQARPRLAVEVRTGGVVAARAADDSGVLAQVSRADLPSAALTDSLKTGKLGDRSAVAAALRRALAPLQMGKLRDVTLIVPDAAVRVLLLDFDALPGDAEDAMAVVRFRLARLLPFSSEAAQISYQVMGERARQVQVLAVAIPRELLAEYEGAVREAGFEPGAVLPSTLAAVAAIDADAQTAALLVNAGEGTLTTAILRRGELLLHRTLDLAAQAPLVQTAAPDAEAYGEDDLRGTNVDEGPLVEEFLSADQLRAETESEEERIALEAQQAISVAAAYYEDSLAAPPETVLTAGTVAAETIGELMRARGMAARELMRPVDLMPTVTAAVAPGMLAGLRGALRN